MEVEEKGLELGRCLNKAGVREGGKSREEEGRPRTPTRRRLRPGAGHLTRFSLAAVWLGSSGLKAPLGQAHGGRGTFGGGEGMV